MDYKYNIALVKELESLKELCKEFTGISFDYGAMEY